MTKIKRVGLAVLAPGALSVTAVPVALAGPPGPGDKPQCAGGKFPSGNGNPNCPPG